MISVIMSVYNREDYIRDCLESVLNQTYKDFEFIIIDDNSSDSTVSIIKSYNDSRIVLIENKENLGLTKNLNRAIKICKGEFIARMDDDDICFPNRFEIEYNFLKKNPDFFAVSSQAIAFGTKNGYCTWQINNNNFIKSFLCFRNIIIHPTVMFRNNQSVFYDEAMTKAQDFELWFRLLNIENKKFGYIKKPLIKYRYHSKQTNVIVQHFYDYQILKRNYLTLFDDFDENIYKIHCNLLGYEKTINLNYEHLELFYNYHKKVFKKYEYYKFILFYELYKYCKRNQINNHFLRKIMLCLFIPKYWPPFYFLVKMIKSRKGE